MADRPLVAVTCDRRAYGPALPEVHGRIRPPRPELFVGEAVVDAVHAAGAEAVLVPPAADPLAFAGSLLARVDGVVITGGAVDVHPSHYGEPVSARLDRIEPRRTALELALARACLERDIPVLGVCGGMQVLAVAAGGRLWQDIATQIPGALVHEQPTDPAEPWHPVRLSASPLCDAFGTDELHVNSTHHQAVRDPGALSVCGTAPDGVVEAVFHPGRRFCLGVQWHPELLDPAPYRALVATLEP